MSPTNTSCSWVVVGRKENCKYYPSSQTRVSRNLADGSPRAQHTAGNVY